MNPNLLPDTRSFSGYANLYRWLRQDDYQDCRKYGRGELWGGLYKGVTIDAGVWYTFSVTVVAEVGVRFILPLLLPNESYEQITQTQREFTAVEKMSYERVSITFKSETSRPVYPRVEINKDYSKNWIQVCQYKLEKGKKATPWCPNVND